MTLVVTNLNTIGETFLICSFPLSGLWASQELRGDGRRRADQKSLPNRNDLIKPSLSPPDPYESRAKQLSVERDLESGRESSEKQENTSVQDV